MEGILKELFEGQRGRQLLLVLADIVIVMFSAYAALALRFTFGVFPEKYLMLMLKCWPFDILITVAVFWCFRLYHRVWAFASINELVKIFQATAVVSLIELFYKVIFVLNMPRSFYLLNFGAMFFLVSLVRLTPRLIDYYRHGGVRRYAEHNIMIVGAGAAGSLLINEINSANRDSRVVCIVDDNPQKKGKIMKGIPIVGGRSEIERAALKYAIDEIILAIPSLPKEELGAILDICNKTECRVRILPAIAKSLTGELAQNVRDISYEDLLGRDQIVVDSEDIGNFLKGKVVMVTGGGGSIGSELCRQIASYNPKTLVIFDIYENNAYDIQMELVQHYPNADIHAIIGSVRDIDRLEDVFRTFRPQVVYHAAAHKHVPLMEESPNEAVKNNCLGTLNTVRMADKYGVERFVLISTDKAVRRTNIMGATKRICEMIVQSYAKVSKTTFAAVRFGNVLGSNGSVIPLFLKQIEEGGPVTVTHKDITRFFMTIPEAVSLVLQAGLYAKGGEIFVLDMGKQVRIYDLAESLIKMKGYRPNEDIDIEIVGLRPGEKLYEEILMDEEGLAKTANQLIYVGQPIKLDEDAFFRQLVALIESAERNAPDIKEQMTKICTTYTITNN